MTENLIDLDLDTDLLNELQEEPTCEYMGRSHAIVGLFQRFISEPCGRPADYIIICACKADDAFLCKQHLDWIKNTDKVLFGLISVGRMIMFSCGHSPSINECKVIPLH